MQTLLGFSHALGKDWDEKRKSLRGRLIITRICKLITVPNRSFNLIGSAGVRAGDNTENTRAWTSNFAS